VTGEGLRFSPNDSPVQARHVITHFAVARSSRSAVVVAVASTPLSASSRGPRHLAFKNDRECSRSDGFSNPPALADLAALTVGNEDFDVRSCRAATAGIRLPAAAIELSQAIDRSEGATAGARRGVWSSRSCLSGSPAYLAGADRAWHCTTTTRKQSSAAMGFWWVVLCGKPIGIRVLHAGPPR